jgi:hypothetical protein
MIDVEYIFNTRYDKNNIPNLDITLKDFIQYQNHESFIEISN